MLNMHLPADGIYNKEFNCLRLYRWVDHSLPYQVDGHIDSDSRFYKLT